FAIYLFFFSSRRRHTRFSRDWSSDVCSSDLGQIQLEPLQRNAELLAHAAHPYLLAPALLFMGGAQCVCAELLELPAERDRPLPRSEERRVGKSGDLGGRRRSNKKIERQSMK